MTILRQSWEVFKLKYAGKRLRIDMTGSTRSGAETVQVNQSQSVGGDSLAYHSRDSSGELFSIYLVPQEGKKFPARSKTGKIDGFCDKEVTNS
jgi:hypothetical protein